MSYKILMENQKLHKGKYISMSKAVEIAEKMDKEFSDLKANAAAQVLDDEQIRTELWVKIKERDSRICQLTKRGIFDAVGALKQLEEKFKKWKCQIWIDIYNGKILVLYSLNDTNGNCSEIFKLDENDQVLNLNAKHNKAIHGLERQVAEKS